MPFWKLLEGPKVCGILVTRVSEINHFKQYLFANITLNHTNFRMEGNDDWKRALNMAMAVTSLNQLVQTHWNNPFYLNNVNTEFGDWFACAAIAVPACCRICERANAEVSTA